MFSPVKDVKDTLANPTVISMEDVLASETGSFSLSGGLTMSASYDGTAEGENSLVPNTLYYLKAFYTVKADDFFFTASPDTEDFKVESAPVEFSTLPSIESGEIKPTGNENEFEISAAFEFLTGEEFETLYGSEAASKEHVPVTNVRIYYSASEIKTNENKRPGGRHPPANTETFATNAGGDYVTDAVAQHKDLPSDNFDTAGIKEPYILDTSDVEDAQYFVIQITNERGDTAVFDLSAKPPTLEVQVPVKMIFAAFAGEKNPGTGLTPIRSPVYTIRARARSPVKVTLTNFTQVSKGKIDSEDPGLTFVDWSDVSPLDNHQFNLKFAGESLFFSGKEVPIMDGNQNGLLGILGEGTAHLGENDPLPESLWAGTFRMDGMYKGDFKPRPFLKCAAVFKFELVEAPTGP
jgi:hypothetical protein